MPCWSCGLSPLMLAWRSCPECSAALRELVLEVPFSRSRNYAPAVAAMQDLEGYQVTGTGRFLVHQVLIDVTRCDTRGVWDVFRVVTRWKGTRLLRDGRPVALRTLDDLFTAYRHRPAAWRTIFSPRGRGVWVEAL